MTYSVDPILFVFSLLLLLAVVIFLLVRSTRIHTSRKEYEKKRLSNGYDSLRENSDQNVKRQLIKPSDSVIRDILIRRIEGIKNRDPQSILDLVDGEIYTKYDDWPPFERQDLTALDREAKGLRVIKEYDYETADWKIDIFGRIAIAFFTIKYAGIIRDSEFTIHSRVTSILKEVNGEWKIIHEHWSRFSK